MSTSPTCILAYTGEHDRFRPLDAAAIESARSTGARLIFYDSDASSRLSAAGASPLPTWWSGEGAGDQLSDRMDPEQLDKAGRFWLKGTVEFARAFGVDAYGWLPSSASAADFADYAEKQHADLLIVPGDLDQNGLAAWLKGQPTLKVIEREATEPIVVVDLELAPVG